MQTKWIVQFVAFFVCGYVSRYVWEPDSWREWLGFPIAFGLLSGWLISRKRFPLYVVLCIAVWNAAYRTTRALSGDQDFLAFSLGGLIGGVGLAASAGMWKPSALATAGIVGTAAAWAFFIPESLNLKIGVPFAIWQGAVGTVLCILHERRSLSNQ